jgi:hypothetical protein
MRLHYFLAERIHPYFRWHDHRYFSEIVHWSIFVLISLTTSAELLGVIHRAYA